MLRYVLLRHNCIYVRAELFCFTRISSYLLCFYWKSSLASPRIVHLERWTTDHLASPRITHYLMCFYWEKCVCGVLPASPRITSHHPASPRITSNFYPPVETRSMIAFVWRSVRARRDKCAQMWRSMWKLCSYKYTERQKKHHFFRATLTKIHCIKINNL